MDKSVLMYVDKGGIFPANEQSRRLLREMGLSIGDYVVVKLAKPRNSRFWRWAHGLGSFCSDNIERFSRFDSHQVLKELQTETGLECDVTVSDIPGLGRLEFKKPRSLSFSSMGEERFSALMHGFARHIANEYMPGMSDRQILEASAMLGGVAP